MAGPSVAPSCKGGMVGPNRMKDAVGFSGKECDTEGWYMPVCGDGAFVLVRCRKGDKFPRCPKCAPGQSDVFWHLFADVQSMLQALRPLRS